MRSEKIRILKNVFGQCISRGEEQLFTCPYCGHHKRKFSVNVDKGYFKCWVCDTRGRNVARAIRKFGSFSDYREWQELNGKVDLTEFEDLFGQNKDIQIETRISLPSEFKTLVNSDLPLSAKPYLNYLRNRGVTKKDIIKWKIGYCTEGEYAKRVIIPSFDSNGYVNYFIARSIYDDWQRYKNPPVSKDIVFNELYLDWDKDVVLVEGVFDAIKAGNAIPILGSTLREDSTIFRAILNNGPKIIIALDDDAKHKTSKIIKMFMSYGVEVLKIDTSGYDDIAEMNFQTFTRRMSMAEKMTSDLHLIDKIINA